jgi:hypothetical protein
MTCGRRLGKGGIRFVTERLMIAPSSATFWFAGSCLAGWAQVTVKSQDFDFFSHWPPTWTSASTPGLLTQRLTLSVTLPARSFATSSNKWRIGSGPRSTVHAGALAVIAQAGLPSRSISAFFVPGPRSTITGKSPMSSPTGYDRISTATPASARRRHDGVRARLFLDDRDDQPGRALRPADRNRRASAASPFHRGIVCSRPPASTRDIVGESAATRRRSRACPFRGDRVTDEVELDRRVRAVP